MKIGILTDTHFGIRNDAPVFYDYFKKSVDFFVKSCLDQGVETVLHLGDVYDRRKYVNFMTAYRARKDLIEPLAYNFKEVVLLAGNHDEYYKNTHKVNSLDELVGDRNSNLTILKEAETWTFDDTEILLVPWITESNRDHTSLQIEETQAMVAMGHFEFKGFLEQKGSISSKGLEPSMFEKFSAVYSGHFHHRHRLGNIQYIGAFTEHYWSDYNDPRGFCIFDTETLEMEFIQNPYSMFHMLSYDDEKTKDILQYVENIDTSGFANSFVRVVAVKKNNPYAFDLLVSKIEKAQPYDISLVEDVSTYTETDETTEIDQTEDTPTILTKYIDGLTMGLDNDKLKKTVLGLHKEALALEII